jgi:hypothetical protein
MSKFVDAVTERVREKWPERIKEAEDAIFDRIYELEDSPANIDTLNAMLGLLLGCGLRRSEVVGLNLDQLQSRRVADHCQFRRKKKTATNNTRTVVEQGASRCLAPAFRSERGKSIQTGVEGGNATRSWCDSQCGLVCGEAMCLSSWHSQFGTSRPSAHLRPLVSWLWRRTGTDPVSSWPRLCAKDRTVHRK